MIKWEASIYSLNKNGYKAVGLWKAQYNFLFYVLISHGGRLCWTTVGSTPTHTIYTLIQ